MAFQLIKTLPGDVHFHVFESLTERLYPAEILKFKSLEGINHGLLRSAYVLLENDMPVARCCLYQHPVLNYQGRKACCIGNFESINDINCSNELFRLATEDAKADGAEYIIGPMNGSTWDTYRLGTTQGQANFFLEPYYPAYYPELFIAAGFEPIAHYLSNIDTEKDLHEERIIAQEKRFVEKGISFRNIDLARYEEELEKLHAFCMNSFQNNFLFTPLSKEAFIGKYLKVKPYIDPQYVILAEDAKQNIVGFIFCLENVYDTKRKGIIVKTLAKHRSVRYGGMGNVLGSKFKRRAMENGYQYIIHAFMIESNASRSLSQHFSGSVLKEYDLYGKHIG